MKKRILAKIGTHSATEIVLWNDKPINIGDIIIAMPFRTYDSLHSTYRNLKSCNYWEKFKVDSLEPVLFLHRI